MIRCGVWPMQKQELIHIHMLVVEIRDFVSKKEPIPHDAFEEYDQNGVAPTAIHYNKIVHKESLQLLLDEIHESLDHTSIQDATR